MGKMRVFSGPSQKEPCTPCIQRVRWPKPSEVWGCGSSSEDSAIRLAAALGFLEPAQRVPETWAAGGGRGGVLFVGWFERDINRKHAKVCCKGVFYVFVEGGSSPKKRHT